MPRLIAVIITVVVFAAACAQGGAVDEPTMTNDQALARVEQLIKQTADVIAPAPRLELEITSLNINKCLDPTDGGSEDRIIIDRGYYLRDIPKDQIGEVARQIKERWEKQGHIIVTVSKTGTSISARSRPDDFLLALGRTGDDVLLLGASSPCIWPNGTPEPSSAA